jgi:hypothetical protein
MDKKILRSMLFSVLCIILGTVLFTGCDQSLGTDVAAERAAVTANPYPEGTWKGTSYDEGFVISTKYLSYTVSGTTVYEGDVVDVVDDTDHTDSGIVYIQYKIAPYGIPGNYYAVRWESYNPVAGTAWFSGCSDADGKKTLAEAEAEYTEANKAKYFGYGSNFVRAAKGKLIPPPSNPGEKPPYLKYLEEKTGLIIVK